MLDTSSVPLLKTWLSARPPGTIVDVGAASGEFIREMRTLRPQSRIVAFEPTPTCATLLASTFASDPLVRIRAVALSDHLGTAALKLYPEPTQNSLLEQSAIADCGRIEVPVSTLDTECMELGDLLPIEVLKIDTQGHDLAVLRGAAATIRRDRPLVQVEVIFAALYEHQASPGEILAWFESQDYTLADMSMPHHDAEGRLAYADWIFAPGQAAGAADQRYFCRDASMLAGNLRMYQQAAEERLSLINRLTTEISRRS